jgi:hypothetical protein
MLSTTLSIPTQVWVDLFSNPLHLFSFIFSSLLFHRLSHLLPSLSTDLSLHHSPPLFSSNYSAESASAMPTSAEELAFLSVKTRARHRRHPTNLPTTRGIDPGQSAAVSLKVQQRFVSIISSFLLTF